MATEKKKIIPVGEDGGKNTAEAVGGSEAAVLEEVLDGTYKHVFSEPFDFEGEKISELEFNFGKLTGGDSLAVEAELLAQSHPVILRTVDGQYLIRMCARACTRPIGYEAFERMPVKDYARITTISKRFF